MTTADVSTSSIARPAPRSDRLIRRLEAAVASSPSRPDPDEGRNG